MAITQARPLLLLLASLFFLPVLRAIDFKYCNKNGYDYGKITRVEISPNPVGPEDDPTIMVFGSANNASKSITEGTVEVFLRSGDRRRESLEEYDLCDDLHACPIEPGKNFVLYLSDVAYSVGIEVLSAMINTQKHSNLHDTDSVASAAATQIAGVDKLMSSYYLHPSDSTGQVQTPILLNGASYERWAKLIMNSLRTKRKIGFVDGSLKRPSSDSDDAEKWDMVNSINT